MNVLETAARQPQSGPTDLPPYLDEADEGMLAVARNLYDNPETVELPDGRQLGYGTTGDPDGVPVLAFHGIPSGRLGAAVFDEIGRDRGIRIIAPERPGVGVSDPNPERSLSDWPRDVACLLDALDIDAAPILGISGGGPYALACGALAPDRFPRVAVCSSAGPKESAGLVPRLLLYTAAYLPWVVRLFLDREIRSAQNAPERTIDRRVKSAAPADEPFWRSDFGKVLVASEPAACQHHGTSTFVRDLQLIGRDWGFALGGIEVPVGIWHGEADQFNPNMGRYLEHEIPTAEAHYSTDLGHIGTIVENEEAIFDWLSQ